MTGLHGAAAAATQPIKVVPYNTHHGGTATTANNAGVPGAYTERYRSTWRPP